MSFQVPRLSVVAGPESHAPRPDFRPGRDYGRATINSWLGPRSQARPEPYQPTQAILGGFTVFDVGQGDVRGGDTVAAVQANWPGGGGEWERRWGPTGTMLP